VLIQPVQLCAAIASRRLAASKGKYKFGFAGEDARQWLPSLPNFWTGAGWNSSIKTINYAK
jgi:hypothetical protein